MVYLPVLIVLLYSGLSLFSIVASLTFQTYRPLAVVANFNGLSVKHHRRNFGSNHRVATLSESRAGSEMDNMNGERVERGPIAPSRNDVCETFISGYIGTEPKEIYLANGHYLLTFSVNLKYSRSVEFFSGIKCINLT